MVSIGPCLTGRVHVLDAAADPADLADFPDRFHVGQPVRHRVLKVRVDAGRYTSKRCVRRANLASHLPKLCGPSVLLSCRRKRCQESGVVVKLIVKLQTTSPSFNVCGWMQLSDEENKTDLTLVVDSQDERLRHTTDTASAGPRSLLMGCVDKLRGVNNRLT